MTSRLVKFLVLTALIINAVEIFVRANSGNLFALSDKLLLKAEILERNPDTRGLCLTTSRFLDAIDERQFSSEIERLTGKNIEVTNAATNGSQGTPSDMSTAAAFISASIRCCPACRSRSASPTPSPSSSDHGFGGPSQLEFLSAWLSLYGFALQILADFWSYSTVAIGLGSMYGIDLPLNFNLP